MRAVLMASVLFLIALPAFAQDCLDAALMAEGGQGSESSPYRIETLCQLQGIDKNTTAHYVLAKKIEASLTRTWNSIDSIPKGFAPIGSRGSGEFSGSFDGRGFKIFNLYINRPGEDSVGLFSNLRAGTLRQVVLIDSQTIGGEGVGGLVGGSLARASISDSSASGITTGTNFVGGLVGASYEGASISDSRSSGITTGAIFVGGLVGASFARASISNSSAGGTTMGVMYVGGLVGVNGYSMDGDTLSEISNSSATGVVSGAKGYVGGLAGANFDNGGISNSFAESSVRGGGGNVGGLVGFNGNFVAVSGGTAGITGNVTGDNNPSSSLRAIIGVGIADINLMARVSSIRNSYATGSVSGMDEAVGGLVGANHNYASISNSSATGLVSGMGGAVGGLVGANHNYASISNSSATGSVSGTGEFVGGFVGANYEGASISNSFTSGITTGTNFVGGLVGISFINASISDSRSSGITTGISDVGGLVGLNGFSMTPGMVSAISNSHAAGEVSASKNNLGGLVGANYISGSISGSYATSSVTGSGDHIGGLVGFNGEVVDAGGSIASASDNPGTSLAVGMDSSIRSLLEKIIGDVTSSTGTAEISNSSATGSVFGKGKFVGGLVGVNGSIEERVGNSFARIDKSYAMGQVSGEGNYVGGLAGFNGYGMLGGALSTDAVDVGSATTGVAEISESYATGDVTGNEHVGGLVGFNGRIEVRTGKSVAKAANTRDISARITKSHATGAVSGRGRNVGGFAGFNGYDMLGGSIDEERSRNSQPANTGGGSGGTSRADIDICYATGDVSGTAVSNVGGLVGLNGSMAEDSSGDLSKASFARISNSYATGSVSGSVSNVGGLVGHNTNIENASNSFAGISDSYATGLVPGSAGNVGGLVGNNTNAAVITGSHYYHRGILDGDPVLMRSLAQLRCPTSATVTLTCEGSSVSYKDWDTQVWNFGSDTDLPQLTSNHNQRLNQQSLFFIDFPKEEIISGRDGTELVLKVDYRDEYDSSSLTWTFDEVPDEVDIYFVLAGGETTTSLETGSGDVATVRFTVRELFPDEGFGFKVVVRDDFGNEDSVPVRASLEMDNLARFRIRLHLGGATR